MTATKTGPVARLSGVFLTEGVSRNNRHYTGSAIRRAVARMQARIADPSAPPISMMTHHAAADDSLRICGRVTAAEAVSMQGQDGNLRAVATFQAELAPTDAGRTVAALIVTESAGAYLRTVSLRGWWVGETRRETVAGEMVETADDLEIDGIDFTRSPGIPEARIDTATLLEGAPGSRRAISETADLATVRTLVPLAELLRGTVAAKEVSDPWGETRRQGWVAAAEATGARSPFWATMVPKR